MSFWTDLGNIVTRQDTASLATADMNLATAEYLRAAAQGGSTQSSEEDNTMITIAVVGSLIVAGGVAFFVLRKK
jgi:hypothetical protein